MAKPVQDKWLHARIDAPTDDRVKEYIKAAHLNMGELVRRATEEYMVNHPIKIPQKTPIERIKPGEK